MQDVSDRVYNSRSAQPGFEPGSLENVQRAACTTEHLSHILFYPNSKHNVTYYSASCQH